MRKAILIAAIATVSLGACSTMDVSQLADAGSNTTADAQFSQNEVIQSAKSLYKKAIAAGWAEPTETSMQKTANILLRGYKPDSNLQLQPYLAANQSKKNIGANVVTLLQHVEQTAKVAQTYISNVEVSADLKAELSFLEMALLSARKSEENFQQVASDYGLADSTDIVALGDAVDTLRDVTNAYGKRVRSQYIYTSANGS